MLNVDRLLVLFNPLDGHARIRTTFCALVVVTFAAWTSLYKVWRPGLVWDCGEVFSSEAQGKAVTTNATMLARCSADLKGYRLKAKMQPFLEERDRVGWLDTCARCCRALERQSAEIPRIVHFAKTDAEFTFMNWVVVLATIKYLSPDVIYMHQFGLSRPRGCWWRLIRPHVRLRYFSYSGYLNGLYVPYPEHISDVIRIVVIAQTGGIYMDLDSLPVRPFGDLWNKELVLGRQAHGAITSAVFMAKPGSCFACVLEQQVFATYDGGWVSAGPALVDHLLETARCFPEATVLGSWAFFAFDFRGSIPFRSLFVESRDKFSAMLDKSYALHLYDTRTRPYQAVLTWRWAMDSASAVATAVRQVFNDRDILPRMPKVNASTYLRDICPVVQKAIGSGVSDGRRERSGGQDSSRYVWPSTRERTLS